LHEAIINDNIDIFEMPFEESVSYFKLLENVEKIRRNNGPGPATLPAYNNKSFTSSVGKSSKNNKGSNMWCHYCDKNSHNHNTVDFKEISKFKYQKRLALKPKLDPERSLWPSFSNK
jgi:hypothetical protein